MPRQTCTPLIAFLLAFLLASGAAGAPIERPKLVLVLVLDQFRQEYMVRYRTQFVPGGFRQLLERGAVFANCHYPYSSTLTAPGHAVIATGSYPNSNGIVGNEWFDRAAGHEAKADRDVSEKLVGADPDTPGASPHWLIGSTLADELRLATAGRARVISISPKGRSAILSAGKGANAAYWFDNATLHAVSSTFYMKELPAWVRQFNAQDWAAKYAGKAWLPVNGTANAPFLVFPKADSAPERRKLAGLVVDSPFAIEVQFALARAAVENEKLGSGPVTDFLALSVSSIDEVGHDHGADGPRTRDTILRADRILAEFLKFLDARIGLANIWIGLSADHGIAPMPEEARRFRLDGGRISKKTVLEKVESALARHYGGAGVGNSAAWVESYLAPYLYLNQAQIRSKELNQAEVARRAAESLLELEGVAEAYTQADLAGCRAGADLKGKVCRSHFPQRAGDVTIVFKPFWMHELSENPEGTWHGTPYAYDTHVPLILVGAPFRAGAYFTPASPADLPVTLAAALGINAPALAAGRVLSEALHTNSAIRTPQSALP